MKVILFWLPTIGTREKIERTPPPIGRDHEAYQSMLEELKELAKAADELGFWGIAHTEHHFHSEGSEISTNPGLLNLYMAEGTRQIRFGSIGYVLPSWDPIRLAEETAMVDHMLKGRFFMGLARGYQDRWVNVLGQKYHAAAAPMDGSYIDQHNRKVFEEVYRIMKLAWTQDALAYKGDYYEVPFPYEQGIRRWPPIEWTRKYGARGEVGPEGEIRKICVVPKPYQQPHPPIFQAFSVSEATIRWCAREEIIPTVLTGPLDHLTQLVHVYQDEANRAGRNLKLGESVGVVRGIWLADSAEEGLAHAERYTGWIWENTFSHFGFWEAFRLPGEQGAIPKPGERSAERLVKADYALVGTPDQVKKKLATIVEKTQPEYLIWLGDQGIMPKELTLRNLELFATRVMPEFC
jgi:alkanesulfonate monooxygenase SsuD/methylene tetrahydromethanopterin reductase-like flavin-dependent oxidoreductase (luciferase family)